VILDRVLGDPALRGVYHVAAAPIAKYDLLGLLAREYGRSTGIARDERVVIDRSLNAERFRAATGYVAAPWPELIARMRVFG
jgi:dTDP-4-dehydrorhamnose reductase